MSEHFSGVDATPSVPDGAPPLPGPHGPASPESRSGPATTTPVRSSLSPEATPFYPSGGRGKHLRWKDATPSDGETSPPSYRDALLRSPPPARRVTFASELAAGGAPPLGSVLDRLGPALVILAGARRRLDALAAAREGAAARRGCSTASRCDSLVGPVPVPAPPFSSGRPALSLLSTRRAGPRRVVPALAAGAVSGWASGRSRLPRRGRGLRRSSPAAASIVSPTLTWWRPVVYRRAASGATASAILRASARGRALPGALPPRTAAAAAAESSGLAAPPLPLPGARPPAAGRPRRRLCHILTTPGVIGASSECPLGLLCRTTALAVAHGTTTTFVC
ncbi:hypothetical protein PVAP13_9KG547000 [Panicum virgatum]|uniref:Uncharacterized protein n=1 Tax=Panicum virgatum TaxID=38727 RepID=A0A8T0P0B3_PANVG|nr:hypothetical protein PVAP13_9KG547000 [Panicum virgatum]